MTAFLTRLPNFVSKKGPKISTNIYWSIEAGLIGLLLCAVLIGNAKQFDAVFLPWIFSILFFLPHLFVLTWHFTMCLHIYFSCKEQATLVLIWVSYAWEEVQPIMLPSC